jgi:hypothetical protein
VIATQRWSILPAALVFLCVGGFVGSAVAAPGQITGVSVAPFPAAVHNPVKITVDGNGGCTFSLNFGDGTRPVVRTGQLSYQQTHAYGRTGTYWIHVKAVSGCSGQAVSTLEVTFSSADFHGSIPKPDALRALDPSRP